MNKLLSWAMGNREAAGAQGPQKRVHLALQGGGAHGAFTWGVLDHLLEDGRLAVVDISGASAGAVNAVMLADGLLHGGPDEARKRLADFWRAASIGGNLPELQRHVIERLFRATPLAGSPVKDWLHTMGGLLAPADLNPLNINPLKQLIERFADFAAIRADTSRELFIAATNVQTGDLRIFRRAEISAEAVMASACLPLLFRAVEIGGVPYWDGGYTANPPLLPFLDAKDADLLIVQVYPQMRQKTPESTRQIMSRASEISFNAPLLAELRAIDLIGRQDEERGGARRLRLHRVALEEMEETFDSASRLHNGYEFFDKLRRLGQAAAQRFLETHFEDIGNRGTIDLFAGSDAERVHA
ncbi:MAG: patatin-like phospholipase family protein [Xanthobacteraceae bacterium]